MKKSSIIFMAMLLAATLPGCAKEEMESEAAYVYCAETIETIVNASSVHWASVCGEDVYLSLIENEPSYEYGFETYIPNGSAFLKYNASSGQLETLSYRGGPYEQLTVSSDGELWILDNINNSLLKLSSELEVIGSFDIPLQSDAGWNSPIFDNNGTMYLYTYAGASGKVIALDFASDKPTLSFSLNVTGMVSGMVGMENGNAAVKYSSPEGDFIRIINSATGSWGESIALDRQLSLVQSTSDGLLMQNSNDVLTIDMKTGEPTSVFNWVYCGLDGSSLIAALPDGSFLVQRGSFYMGEELSIELVSPIEVNEPPIVLRLASDNGSQFQAALSKFNREHDDIKIELLDYSVYRTGTSMGGVSGENFTGTVRLIADLTSGMSIDIVDLSSVSVQKYVQGDKLVDLYPYIDADTELSRNDFFENILTAMEIEGGLYEIAPRISILTMLANAELVEPGSGWTIEEMRQGVSRGADSSGGPFPWYNVSPYLLDSFLVFYMDDLIDWSAGTVNFNTEEFCFALELANTNAMENDYLNIPDDVDILQGYLASFYTISTPYDPLGAGERNTVIKGVPTSQGIGNAATGLASIGLLSTSAHQEEAWEFMRCFLLADGPELGYGAYGFSINKARFETDLENEFGKNYSPEEMELYGYVYMGGVESDLGDWARQLMNSVSRVIRKDADIQSIVAEEAMSYFAGDKTMAETVSIIESKIKTYVAE